jgi:hypothetical protein
MTTVLYWFVYNFDFGPLGPRLLDMAVQAWLRRERRRSAFSRRLSLYRALSFGKSPA